MTFDYISSAAYVVPSAEYDRIKELLKEKKSINSEDFQSICVKLRPELKSSQAKQLMTELFDDIQSNGFIDFDGFLIAYAFARSLSRLRF
jgi:hypothetical protein